ncbi:MAG TPA: PEF-CTERM sorting domain-containing protein [Candidatus Methanoperedenaceae archaeon]|nr:PEF-CTERM sorting domain-containing protein [Candidatus Methanoperedenaceae archaeon]
MMHNNLVIKISAVLLSLMLAALVDAKNNGVSDGDFDLNQTGQNPPRCGSSNCHIETLAGSGISISASSAGPHPAKHKTDITINVTTSDITDPNDILGIMLLNNTLPYNGNIKHDGWQITGDANGNPSPYSYNERAVTTLNQTFSWNITAPSTPGTYYIRAQARYGGGTGYVISSTPLTMAVQLPVPEFPAGAALPIIASAIAFILMRKKMC